MEQLRCILWDSSFNKPFQASKQTETLPVLRWPEDQDQLHQYTLCYANLSDASLQKLLARDLTGLTLCLLPNSKNPHSQRGFAIPSGKLEQLIESEQYETLSLDLLFCNEQPVLNKVVVGKTFAFQPGGHSKSLWQRLKITREQLRSLRSYSPRTYTLCTDDDQRFSFSALGLCFVPHVVGSHLSKRVLADNDGKDGRFSSLIVAPDHLLEMLTFLVSGPFTESASLPEFLGVLRTHKLTLINDESISYRHDDQAQTATELSLYVREKALQLQVPHDSPLLALAPRQKDTRKLRRAEQSVETRQELSHKPLPWLRHASTEDFKDLYFQLRSNASCTSAFFMFMVLSAALASLGLLANSAPVIIGAMILAPLMAPIISMAMGFVRQDTALLQDSGKTVLTGAIVAIAVATVFAVLIPLTTETHELRARLHPNLLDLLVAVFSGIAGAYAHARTQVAKSLAGVAIAVALVPPLAASGIGLAWLKTEVAGGALLLFLTNLAGIVFAAAATFYCLGFAPFHRARKGLVVALMAVLLLAIPLSVSFNQLRRYSDIMHRLEALDTPGLLVRNYQLRSLQRPLVIGAEVLTSRTPDPAQLKQLQTHIEQQLAEPVVLEVNWLMTVE